MGAQKNWYSKIKNSSGEGRNALQAPEGGEQGAENVVISRTLPPFLKWAGGKRWLMPLARQLVSQDIGTYYEPFVGSGAMFFALRPEKSVLSDFNEDLISAYLAIRNDWQSVLRELRRHHRNHCQAYYYEMRSSRPRTAHTQAARFIYLNRTCWNGLYRVNRDGVFNTPIGTKKNVLLDSDDFEAVAKSLAGANLLSGDFEDVIDRAGKGDFIFADPPYTVRHQFNGFVKYNEKLFSWSDQERLMESLRRAVKRGAKVLCTNADHHSVRELYGDSFLLTPVNRYSSISGTKKSRGTYAELIITG